jgi:hypothetical protein
VNSSNHANPVGIEYARADFMPVASQAELLRIQNAEHGNA